MRVVLIAIAVLITIALVGFGAALWYTDVIPPDCVLGVAGSDATVHVEGLGARTICRQLEATIPGAYIETAPRVAHPLLCRLPVYGRRATVRDTGTFKVVGSSICDYLARLPPLTTPAPTR